MVTPTARGIFLGAAVGDALGWPQEVRGGIVGGQKERDRLPPKLEFHSWIRYAGRHTSRYDDPVLAGEYSDDTQLLLATARCCLGGGDWWQRLTEVELPAWPIYQRGGGGAVLRAASCWAEGRPPWRGDGPTRVQATERRYRGAGANGVAMRIAPHVLWAKDSEELITRVVRDGITTHGHPRALVGALVYAFALRHAAHSSSTYGFGDSVNAAAQGLIDPGHVLPLLPADWGDARQIDLFAETWESTNRETNDLLGLISQSLDRGAMSDPETTLEELGCSNPKINGAGTVSAAGAIYLASRFAARSQSGLLSAAFLRKADTDTLASLTGAILGALHGTTWLGDLAFNVQDANYLASLAVQTGDHHLETAPWPTREPRTLRRLLRDALLQRDHPYGEFPDGRVYRVDETVDLRGGRMFRARLHLDDGQNVIVDVQTQRTVGSRQQDQALFAEPLRESRPTVERDSQPRPRGVVPGDDSMPAFPPRRPPAPRFLHLGARVILATQNLTRSAAFYAQLTGRNVPVRAGTAEISPEVLLNQAPADTPVDTSSVVAISVDDIPEALRRIGLDIRFSAMHPEGIDVQDPDGRTVHVTLHKDPTSSNL